MPETKLNLVPHELAEAFPDLTEKAYQELLVDIRDNGQLVPIVLFDGQILDGKNRYRACEELGLKPITQEYRGTNPAGYVISLNINRRHLTASQRAIIADKISQWSTKGNNRHGGTKTQAEAAEQMNVDSGSVKMARRTRRQAPKEVYEAMDAGEVNVTDAGKVAKKSHAIQKQALADKRSGKTKTMVESVKNQEKGVRPKGSTVNLKELPDEARIQIRGRVAVLSEHTNTLSMSHLGEKARDEVWDLVVELSKEHQVDIAKTAPAGKTVDQDDRRLAKHLIDKVLKRFPHQSKKSPNHNDLETMRLLRAKHDDSLVEEIIDWACEHTTPEFSWRDVIRSTAKLSKHFDTLIVQKQAKPRGAKRIE